jgi:hypothetical protein
MKKTTDSIQQEVSSCCLCGVIETNGHIFFQCHIARTIWFSFKEALGWDKTPQSMQDVFLLLDSYWGERLPYQVVYLRDSPLGFVEC